MNRALDKEKEEILVKLRFESQARTQCMEENTNLIMEIQKLNTKLKIAEEREVKLMSEHARMLDENQIDVKEGGSFCFLETSS